VTWVEPTEWYATLPSFYAAASAVITDADDRILMVRATYRDYWTLPGGMVEAGESPDVAAAREVAEELGLIVNAGALLAIAWQGPRGLRPRAVVQFIFDGGLLVGGGQIRPAPDEIADVGFFPLAEIADVASPAEAVRLTGAMDARSTGRCFYSALPGPGAG
jgi:8-oxo-dGTP diphosphatase